MRLPAAASLVLPACHATLLHGRLLRLQPGMPPCLLPPTSCLLPCPQVFFLERTPQGMWRWHWAAKGKVPQELATRWSATTTVTLSRPSAAAGEAAGAAVHAAAPPAPGLLGWAGPAARAHCWLAMVALSSSARLLLPHLQAATGGSCCTSTPTCRRGRAARPAGATPACPATGEAPSGTAAPVSRRSCRRLLQLCCPWLHVPLQASGPADQRPHDNHHNHHNHHNHNHHA
jgi:hypothetical protein